MTREEAIKILYREMKQHEKTANYFERVVNERNTIQAFDGAIGNRNCTEALNMAIKALQQETVSRETYTHEYCLRKAFEMKVFELEKKIAEQEPKRGKWVDKGDFYICSECGKRMTYAVLGSEFLRAYAFMSDYCPHCGARMESDEH